MLPFTGQRGWQMTFGERAAVIGVLQELRPQVAVEIGTAAGGSLRPAAQLSSHVHSFDLEAPADATDPAYGNVTFHQGDSHELLPRFLAEAENDGIRITYALVDGDHSAEGARRDVEDLLASPAFEGVMLIHDSINPDVRNGILSIDQDAYPHLHYLDLDFVPGRMMRRRDVFENQLWGGLALAIAHRGLTPELDPMATGDNFRDAYALLRPVKELIGAPKRARTALRHPDRLVAAARRRLRR